MVGDVARGWFLALLVPPQPSQPLVWSGLENRFGKCHFIQIMCEPGLSASLLSAAALCHEPLISLEFAQVNVPVDQPAEAFTGTDVGTCNAVSISTPTGISTELCTTSYSLCLCIDGGNL